MSAAGERWGWDILEAIPASTGLRLSSFKWPRARSCPTRHEEGTHVRGVQRI